MCRPCRTAGCWGLWLVILGIRCAGAGSEGREKNPLGVIQILPFCCFEKIENSIRRQREYFTPIKKANFRVDINIFGCISLYCILRAHERKTTRAGVAARATCGTSPILSSFLFFFNHEQKPISCALFPLDRRQRGRVFFLLPARRSRHTHPENDRRHACGGSVMHG